MTIQWFPGHMLETKNLLKNSLSKVDAVLEILDARLPLASENPLVDRLCKDKARVKILNKSDLADPVVTEQWLTYFDTQRRIKAIALCATQAAQTAKILDYGISLVQRNRARKLKLMVVGIPNTGKSTILNTLAGKKIAKTGNIPAVTRQQQRTSLKDNIDIYDTPGILWPVIDPPQRAYALAASGAIADTAIDYYDIGYYAAGLLLDRYSDLLLGRYDFMETLPQDPAGLIQQIGQARGCLKKGGIVDSQKAAEILIRDLRSGKIGRISFESPKDVESTHERI